MRWVWGSTEREIRVTPSFFGLNKQKIEIALPKLENIKYWIHMEPEPV
jgi:hypothetical protein